MPKSVNRSFLLGNVGKDPQINFTPGGIAATFSLATTDREKDQQGNWRHRTEWHNLVAYGRTAEIVRDYVRKGSQLFIQGKIQTRSWEDKQSRQKRYQTEIFVHDLTLLSSGQGVDGTYYCGRRKINAPRRESSAPQFEQEFQDQELSLDEIAF